MADNKKLTEDVGEIDKNLKIEMSLGVKDIVFYDVKSKPFDLYGAYKGELESFKRMPSAVAQSVSKGVTSLNLHTSGIRVRFTTDSDYIAIKSIMPTFYYPSHMALTGSMGFDLYEVEQGVCTYLHTFVPPREMTDGYESIAYLKGRKERSFEINFPLYNKVNEVYLGIREGSSLKEGAKYKYEKPVLYYGSSTTQGGCASKPSDSYQSIISHDLDCNFINLGFSGSALGEKEMVDYLCTIDASVFVCDYDGNSPNAEHLRKTHLPLYKAYREKNPDTPILFMSHTSLPNRFNDDLIERRQIILDTYNYAIKNGDKNVSFLDGRTMFSGRYANVYTVDGVHPTSAGFLRMAEVIGREVEIMLRRA